MKFYKIESHFSPILCNRVTWNLFCILTHMDTLCKKISCSSFAQFSRKIRWYLAKIQSCTIVLINNFEILQVSIPFFFDTVRQRNLKFILHINPYGFSVQKNFMFLGCIVLEKNAMISCKIQSCTIVLINNF